MRVTIDFVVSFAVFAFVIAFSVLYPLSFFGAKGDLSSLAFAISENLLSPGFPEDWDSNLSTLRTLGFGKIFHSFYFENATCSNCGSCPESCILTNGYIIGKNNSYLPSSSGIYKVSNISILSCGYNILATDPEGSYESLLISNDNNFYNFPRNLTLYDKFPLCGSLYNLTALSEDNFTLKGISGTLSKNKLEKLPELSYNTIRNSLNLESDQNFRIIIDFPSFEFEFGAKGANVFAIKRNCIMENESGSITLEVLK